MKTIFRILLVLIILFVLLIGTGIFILTRPGVQKSIVESQLPEGSSLRTVRITTSSLELSELKLALQDGTQIRLEMLDTDFKILDAIFDRTVKLGALNVDGLVVEIPKALIQPSAPSEPPLDLPPRAIDGDVDLPAPTGRPEPQPPAGSPMDALYALGQFDWLLDIDSVLLKGELRDGGGSSYAIDLKSGAIRPGQETTIDASLKLRSREALHAGLKEFDASSRIFLKQNIDGGFEQVRLKSLIEASDAAGNNLLAASNELNLSAEGFKERAAVTVDFNADLPRPDVFLPELSGVGAINLQGSLKAGAEGEELTLSHADLLLSASDVDVVSVKLNKSFTLGGNQDLSGNLMDFRVTNLPLAWLALWLPEGASLSGNALSAEFNLTGLPGGALQFSSTAPLQLGPLSFSQDGVALLNEISILAQPVVRYRSDGSVSWSINEFQIQDRYGEILTGQSEGSFNQSAPTAALLPAGLKTQTTLNLGLQQITQQPALSGYTSIFSGRAKLELMVDPSQAHPVQALGRLDGISPRAYPGQRQNYRFELKLSEPRSGALALDAILQAGSESNPSSTLELTGQVIPGVEPLEFKTDLIAQRMSQGDIEMLKAAFLPEAEAAPPVPNRPSLIPPVASTPKPTPPPAISPAGPPWAGYDGELTVSIGELYLLSGEVLTGLKARAVVSEPLLRLSDLEASLLDGNIAGSFEARYSKGQRMAYALKTDLKFDKIDPAVFAMKRKDIPVKGLFAGQARFEGQGAKFEDAVDAIQGELVLTGRDGVLTAFDLDSLLSDFLPGRLGRMRLGSLGLLGASVLGDQLDRPGIRALAEAIPYFENMPFTDFTLKLTRGADQRVIVPQLEFVGRNLLIQGSGSIAATQLRDILNQPMDLALELGAKGQLIDSLETLELLQPDSSEDGFRRWKDEIQIKGSLGDPDTSALERVLRQAANRALRESKKEEEETPDTAETAVAPQAEEEAAVPTEQVPEEKLSKEERILRDVGTGLDILFGR